MRSCDASCIIDPFDLRRHAFNPWAMRSISIDHRIIIAPVIARGLQARGLPGQIVVDSVIGVDYDGGMMNDDTAKGVKMDDELLIQALMDLVPNAHLTSTLSDYLTEQAETDREREVLGLYAKLLKGYGTLLNVLQSASELEGDLAARLSGGYFEHTNNLG